MRSFFKIPYISYLISFLIFFPLILLQQYYLDDNYRSTQGYYGWSGDYRPFANLIYYLVGGTEDFIDIFPLTYILQFFIVANFLNFFTKKISLYLNIKEKNKILLLISLSLVFLNPLFFQNLYYRYDSLPMIISLVIVFFSFFSKNKFLETLGLVATLLIYQPTIWSYTILTCLGLIKLLSENKPNKEIYLYILHKFFSFTLAIFIFLIYVKLIAEPNSYASHHFQFINNFLDLKKNIILSFSNYIFYNNILGYVVSFFIFFIFLFFILDDLSINRVFLTLLICVVFLINLLSTNILLNIPNLYPRVYVSFGVLCFTISVPMLFLVEKNKKFKIICYLFILIPFFVFMKMYFVLFNMQVEKNDKEKIVFTRLIDDLAYYSGDYDHILVYGDLIKTNRYRVLEKKYPILGKVSESNFNMEKHHILTTLISNYYEKASFYDTHTRVYNFELERVKGIKPIKKSIGYKVYVNDRVIFFILDSKMNEFS